MANCNSNFPDRCDAPSQPEDLHSLEEALLASGFSRETPLPQIESAPTCSYRLETGRTCSNRGKLAHGGAWFCGHHHPDVQAERRQQRDLRWVARLRPLPVGQAQLTAAQREDLGLPLLSCDTCQVSVVTALERVVRALEPFERDGKLSIPGLESLMETRDVLARARNGLLRRPGADSFASSPAALFAAVAEPVSG